MANEEAHEQIQQQEKQRWKLENSAASRIKPWAPKLQIDDYDFRSCAKRLGGSASR